MSNFNEILSLSYETGGKCREDAERKKLLHIPSESSSTTLSLEHNPLHNKIQNTVEEEVKFMSRNTHCWISYNARKGRNKSYVE